MAQALDRIREATGANIDYDPDGVRDLTARPVRNAANASEAVRQAIGELPLSLVSNDGRLMVNRDIVVRAKRDEAESSVLVRQSSTSSRTGDSLRKQPRSAQVISDRLIREQQSLTVVDALRNAGNVSVNSAAVQGGATFSVRGFNASGGFNGLPGSVNNPAGATQPVANIERIEVLKGPDAILIGSENLGGLINIVTKKPSADPFLTLDANTGSFGLRRFVLDGNSAITDDRKLSARVIGSASGSDRNFGGYSGDNDWLFAPSLRFKDSATDIILSATISEQFFGSSQFAVLNPATGKFFDIPRDRPVLKNADQGLQIDTTQLFGEVTHKPASWLTLVARGQHLRTDFEQAQFAALGLIPPDSLFISGGRTRQESVANAIDGFARIKVTTGAFAHTLIGGYTYSKTDTDSFSGPFFFGQFRFLTAAVAPARLTSDVSTLNLEQSLIQSGYYGQYQLRVWRLAFLAGVRNNRIDASANNIVFNSQSREVTSSTVPNFGATLDVTDNLMIYSTLGFGYFPNSPLDRNGNRLPDSRNRNAEVGVKIDFFDDRVMVDASYFDSRQTNIPVIDPGAPPNPITGQLPFTVVPGQTGRGFDISVTGQVTKEFSLNSFFSRTTYGIQSPNEFLRVVVGQPRDTYSAFALYRRPTGKWVVGGSGGVFGRSSAFSDSLGEVSSPASFQLDLGVFVERGPLSLNLTVRNVTDRVNYGTSFQSTIFPVSPPRTWGLNATYRLK